MQRPLFKLAVATALVCGLPAAMADVLPGQPQSARLLTALALIVPQPYEINVDNSIPTDTRLSWGEQGDWEQQLRQAAESAGLGVRFNVPARSLLIFRLPRIHRVTVGLTAATVATPRDDAPLVTGADGSAWQTHIAAGGPMGLSSALFRILPSDLAAANIEIVGLSDSQPVSWQAGSRRQALMQVAQSAHARVIVTPQNIRLEPASVGSTAVASASAGGPLPIPAPDLSSLSLVAGKPLGEQLREQGKARGWTVIWKLPHDWIVPNRAAFSSDFPKAVQEIVRDLAANGADIGADVYQGNRTVVVHSEVSK
jgi:hypothetical protein